MVTRWTTSLAQVCLRCRRQQLVQRQQSGLLTRGYARESRWRMAAASEAAAAQESLPEEYDSRTPSSNPPMAFPCMDALDSRTRALRMQAGEAAVSNATEPSSITSGPEPTYSRVQSGFKTFHSEAPLICDHGGVLPEFDIAYETWGRLNADKSNAILLHTGLSASSHAKSHAENPAPGWWEEFIGPGRTLDTDQFFVICSNAIGGCYGSTGPSSLDPGDGMPYATRFPIVTQHDMVRAQFKLLDHLGIHRLYASVGCSMGGMQSIAAGYEGAAAGRVGRIVSVSGGARSHPYSIAMRHTQRQVLMNDPNWNRGFYYDSVPPHVGLKLAREIATITYRSGPEWEQRFGVMRADPSKPPAFCPDYLIETYLDHAGEKFCLEYDANSFLYISKAMDIFDMSRSHLDYLQELRSRRDSDHHTRGPVCLPRDPYQEQPKDQKPPSLSQRFQDLVQGLEPLRDIPVLVIGVLTDNLMPVSNQRELADALRESGNVHVEYVELGMEQSLYGHDTFLIKRKGADDVLGSSVKMFLQEDGLGA